MSHDPHNSHDHKSADEINYVKVIGVGVSSLVVFALCTFWAAKILHLKTAEVEKSSGMARLGAEVGKAEIGIVDQVPFQTDTRLEEWRASHNARLNGYGWVDRAKGIAHVPIERAMDAVASGALPMGAPR
jgi:hypothetical protein